MAAIFPNGIDPLPQGPFLTGFTIHPYHVSNLWDIALKIEEVIGLNPTGVYVDLASRFSGIETNLDYVSGLTHADSTTASNIGYGEGLFSSKVGYDLQFKSITGSGTIEITQDGNTIVISGNATGECNTAANIGGGYGLFSAKVGEELQFKTLLESGNLRIIDNGNTLILSGVSASDLTTGSNVGGGYGLFKGKSGYDLTFKTLLQSGNISIIQNGSDELIISGIETNLTSVIESIDNLSGIVAGLTTTDIPEGTRLYYTDARARSIVSGVEPILVSNGGISIIKSDATHSGYLSEADWGIFNGKQNALGYTPLNKAGDTATGTVNVPVLSGTIISGDNYSVKNSIIPYQSGVGTVGSSTKYFSGVYTNEINNNVMAYNIYNERPSGVINNVNTIFYLNYTPYNRSERLYQNGLRLTPSYADPTDYDYIIVTSGITFITAPISGTKLLSDYIYI